MLVVVGKAAYCESLINKDPTKIILGSIMERFIQDYKYETDILFYINHLNILVSIFYNKNKLDIYRIDSVN